MRANNISKIYVVFFVLAALLNIGATCKYTVHDTEVCSVAGVMMAGMDCAHTRSDETRSMTLDQTIEFLEPQVGDPKTGKGTRAGAMCMTAGNYVQQKNDLETVCRMLGERCSYEIKQAIADANRRIVALQTRTIKKAALKK
jgi:hypothetical protein